MATSRPTTLFSAEEYEKIADKPRYFVSSDGSAYVEPNPFQKHDPTQTSLRTPYIATVPDSDISPQEQAEACGWQIDSEKFLWEEKPQSKVTCILGGDLGQGSVGIVEEVRSGTCYATMARKSVRLRTKTKMEQRIAARKIEVIRNEIDIMKRLFHPHIVKMLGCYQEIEENHLWVRTLMHPVGDNNLAVFLRDGFEKMSNAQKRLARIWIGRWFLCLASALTYMHSEKVVHEDIKPENIICYDTRILFTDFSSSRDVTSGDTSTESWALATRRYAAPEAMKNLTNDTLLRHGTQSDVFSLGLVFVEMLTIYIAEYLEGSEGLRKYVFGNQEGQGEYHRNTKKLSEWFQETPGVTMYHNLIRLMLRRNRKTRPTAYMVLERLCKGWPAEIQPACECIDITHSSVRSNEQASTAPLTVKNLSQHSGQSRHSQQAHSTPSTSIPPPSQFPPTLPRPVSWQPTAQYTTYTPRTGVAAASSQPHPYSANYYQTHYGPHGTGI
jgi:serine/threonine protein kinase